VLLCPLLSSTVCPLSVSTSHCTVLCHYVHCCLLQSVHCLSVPHIVLFCVIMYTAVFYSLSTVCQYLTLHCSVSLCSLLPSRVCPLPVSTSHCTVLWEYVHRCLLYSVHCLPVPLFCVLCQYVHRCLLQSLYYLSIPHIISSAGFVSLCALLSSTDRLLSASISHSICCHHTASYPAAITPSAASQWQLWQTWF
jgi:hypothetical protein